MNCFPVPIGRKTRGAPGMASRQRRARRLVLRHRDQARYRFEADQLAHPVRIERQVEAGADTHFQHAPLGRPDHTLAVRQ